MAMNVSEVVATIAPSCKANEYGDIRSMLDEYLPHPSRVEKLRVLDYLSYSIRGAWFNHSDSIGWYYDE
jgi:hypothetical protein